MLSRTIPFPYKKWCFRTIHIHALAHFKGSFATAVPINSNTAKFHFQDQCYPVLSVVNRAAIRYYDTTILRYYDTKFKSIEENFASMWMGFTS